MEKVIVTIKPEGEVYKEPYTVTFESSTPMYVSKELAKAIVKMLRETDGVENIRTKL